MQTETSLQPSQVETLGDRVPPPPPPNAAAPAPAPLQPAAAVQTQTMAGDPARSPAPESRSHPIAGQDIPLAGAIMRGDGTIVSRDDVNAMLVSAVEQFDITPDEIAAVMQKYFMHDILDYRRERDLPRSLPVQVAA